MKWFKHDTDCDHSEGLSYLIDHEGFAGYGRWFRLLEIVADKIDSTDKCYVEYSTQKWCSLLGLKQKKLKTFLELTENKLKTKVVYSENIIKIEIPNLLKKRDDYSRKSGHSPEKVTPRYKKKEIRNKKEPCEPSVHGTQGEKKETSQHQSVIKFFFELVEREKGFAPEVDGGDGLAVKEMLKSYPVEQLCDMIRFYLTTDKAIEKGITLKAIFSTHSVNVYLANNAKKTTSVQQPGSPQLEMVKEFRERQGVAK